MKPLFGIALLVAFGTASSPVGAAPGTIVTVAGGGTFQSGVPAAQARIETPRDIVFDAAGTYYFITTHAVRKVTGGVISTVAGSATPGFSGDGGPATAAGLNEPSGLALDSAGNLFIADTRNYRVRRVDTQGIITTVAGTGTSGFAGDNGPAALASLTVPVAVAIDDAGALLIADAGAHRVRKVANGVITTVAGNGSGAATSDGGGVAVNAALPRPRSVISDRAGGFYLLHDHSAWRIFASGSILHIAGGGTGGDGGLATAADITTAVDIVVTPSGRVRILQFMDGIVREIDEGGIINRVVGSCCFGFSGDGGPALDARFASPFGMAFDGAGNFFVADTANYRIRRVDAAGIVNTVAGVGYNGPATSAIVASPGAVAVSPLGGFVLTQDGGDWVLKVDGSGTISKFHWVSLAYSVAADAAGNVYIAYDCCVIRRAPDGSWTSVASAGARGGIAIDGSGNLYIADAHFMRVNKVTPAGVVSTFAGSGVAVHGGDGGLATNAGMQPQAVAVDAAGNVFIADGNQRVRKVDTAGIITTVAGNGSAGFGGDGGLATLAMLNDPRGVAVDADGNLYIADRSNNRIRVVDADGVIQTLAGTGVAGFSGDGEAAIFAMLDSPAAVAWDAAGFLLIADQRNGRIRRVQVSDPRPNAFSFPSQADVPLSSLVQSASVTPSGFDSAAPTSITGGEYSIGCTGTFITGAASIQPGQAVCVRHVSSNVYNRETLTVLTIAGVQANFISTTVAGPGAISILPASLDFGGQSMNTTAMARNVTLTNSGDVTVTVNAVSISPGFAASHDCATLAPAEFCTVNVTFTPTAIASFNGTLRLQNSPGTQTVALAGIGERSLATHYYRAILRRAPDPSGKEFWEREAARLEAAGANPNETWIAMATAFFFSPEYTGFNRDDNGFVTDLYRTFFNREPDAPGMAFWTSGLAEGLPREVVMVSFVFSPEFAAFTRAIFGDVTTRAEVDMVMDFYRGLLSRLPEAEGLQSWVQRFRTAQCAGPGQVYAEADTISAQFLTGAEYIGRERTNGHYVGDLYNAFMRRAGDSSGVRYWIGQLNTGARTREQERAAFITTPEFNGRVQRIVSQGCLRP